MRDDGFLLIHWIGEGEKADSLHRSWEVEVNGATHAYEY